MPNYFVKPESTFTVVCPFDISDPENPQLMILGEAKDMHVRLNAVKEENIEYHTITFKNITWGLDCLLRELAYSGSKSGAVQDRVFSQERLNEVRLRYLLVDSSFFAAIGKKVTFSTNEGQQILSPDCEGLIKQLGPITLAIMLRIANNVWDYGVSPKELFTIDDYKFIRKDPKGVEKLAAERIAGGAVVNEGSETAKKG